MALIHQQSYFHRVNECHHARNRFECFVQYSFIVFVWFLLFEHFRILQLLDNNTHMIVCIYEVCEMVFVCLYTILPFLQMTSHLCQNFRYISGAYEWRVFLFKKKNVSLQYKWNMNRMRKMLEYWMREQMQITENYIELTGIHVVKRGQVNYFRAIVNKRNTLQYPISMTL